MKQQTNIRGQPFACILSALVVIWIVSVGVAGAVTLTPILTGLPNPIGLDHKEPQNEVLMSENYPSGIPNNFVLVNFSGGQTPFSTISGLTDEVYIATVRTSSSEGGFTVGEAFTGNGVPGQITRISPDGSTIIDPWVTLPGETGLLRGALFQDRYGSFGGDLIVTTTSGSVWRVTSGGVPTKLATVSSNGEGLTTVPNDPGTYGPWAGKILIGSEGSGVLSTVDSSGNVVTYNLGIPSAESIQIIPANANFFGVNFPSTLMGAPASDFVGMVGDFTIAEESGNLWHVRWNSTTGDFDKDLLATVSQWEGTTFSPASIVGLPSFDVTKDFRFTDVNFTATPAQLGTLLPMNGSKFNVSYVIKPKTGTVASTNPGQLYGVVTINGTGVQNITIDDTFGTQFVVNPAHLDGGVDVLRVNTTTGIATVITDTQVTASTVSATGPVDLTINLTTPLASDETVMVYIKYMTSLKGLLPDYSDFVNTAVVTTNLDGSKTATAAINFVPHA